MVKDHGQIMGGYGEDPPTEADISSVRTNRRVVRDTAASAWNHESKRPYLLAWSRIMDGHIEHERCPRMREQLGELKQDFRFEAR